MLKKTRICIIGSGNMGVALIKGLQQYRPSTDLWVLEKNQALLARLKQDESLAGIKFSAPSQAVDLLVLVVKPQDVAQALQANQTLLAKQKTLVVSVAAGIELKTLAQHAPANQPIIRAMPNVGALVGQAATAIAANDYVSQRQLALAEELFTAVGMCVRVEEKHMDAVTALSGSGPAYMAIIMEALSDAGVAQGLPRDIAQNLAVATMQGASQLVRQLQLHPAQMKDMVASPGGTTIHAIMALEQSGLRSAIMQGVKAAAQRSRELS